MLEYIRSNAQSWGVKAAFAVIILVFVFWGVGNMGDSGASGVVATVNGKAILAQDFGAAYRNAEENIRLRNPNITSDQMKQMNIGPQVLQQLIIEALVQEEATRTGIVITPLELRRAIARIPSFQNAQGKFDAEAYQRILAGQRSTPGRFEEKLRKDLLDQKLREQVSAGSYVMPSEARALYDFSREQRAVDYVFFPAKDYETQTIAEDSLKAYYESNRASFMIPPKIKVEYIEASPASLVDPSTLSAEAVKDYYQKNPNAYTSPERVDVRHILLRLAEDAPAAEVQKVQARMDALAGDITKGADFAALARANSEDAMTAPKGGEVGLIARGDTVPAFEEAAFALPIGQVSAPVRTPYGLHLIKVNAREEAKVQPLAEVENAIRKQLATLQGIDHVREVLDNLIEGNILGKNLTELAQSHKLQAHTTELLSAPEVRQKLGLTENSAATLMATPAKSPVDTALEAAQDVFIVARVLEAVPAGTQDFAAVRDEIKQKLRAENAQKAALEAATTVRKDMGDTLPAALKNKVKTSAAFGRGEAVPGLGQYPELSPAIFTATVGQWMPSAFPVIGPEVSGAALVRVQKVFATSDEEWQTIEPMLASSLENSRKNEVYRMFLLSLGQRAKVEVKNASIVNGEGVR
ncbi:MAG: SurA N-terminal domain-containing protein [Desulfovibrionaceae bacterium]